MSQTDNTDEVEAELDRPPREVMRSVETSLDAVRQDAALAANMNPYETEVVDAGVTDQGDLKLYLEGEEL